MDNKSKLLIDVFDSKTRNIATEVFHFGGQRADGCCLTVSKCVSYFLFRSFIV